MNVRSLIVILLVAGASLLIAASAEAHRLDEYLQATRISVAPERVSIEIDLTPGAAIAPFVVAMMDADHDGQISAEEGVAYARRVLSSVVLEVDGLAHPIEFVSNQLPSIREMNEGVGVIRLLGSAETRPDAPGRHRLYYRNTNHPEMSVYLANALVPESDRIKIAEQERDTRQHELRFDYSVSPATTSTWAPTAWWLIPLFVLAALIARFRAGFRMTGAMTTGKLGRV